MFPKGIKSTQRRNILKGCLIMLTESTITRKMVLEEAIARKNFRMLKSFGFNQRMLNWIESQADPLNAWRKWMANI